MNKVRLVSAAIALLGVYPVETGYAADADIDLSKFTKTFDEDFNSLDSISNGWVLSPNTNWINHTPWGGDFGDAVWDFAAFSTGFDDGVYGLQIKAWKDSSGRWHAGGLSTCDRNGNGFAQKYGYFETRMKVPGGMGTWPGFWLDQYQGPTSKTAPSAEIDVVEFYGGWPNLYHANWRIWRAPGGHQGGGITVTAPTDLTTDYHIYGVLVDPDFITWYLDGQQVWQQPTPKLANVPLCVLLDYALGSGWGESGVGDPSYLNVQWVKVYKRLNGGSN